MICKKIYNVDLSSEITPLQVRDAMVECFKQAHAEVMAEMKEYHEFQSEEEFSKMEYINVVSLVKSIFGEIKADFDHPTKEDLLKAMDKLAEYAVNFRKPEIIKKHHDEIMLLINKLS